MRILLLLVLLLFAGGDAVAADSKASRATFVKLMDVQELWEEERYDEAVSLGDGQVHALTWTRGRDGAMRVALDGKTLMSVTDRSFKEPFDGFAMINAGGDYALRQIRIDGTE